jgi:hypothetical protein
LKPAQPKVAGASGSGHGINLIYRKVLAWRLRYERARWDAAGRGNMTKEDCRANALKCYQFAQKATDREVRRTLFDLSVQWRELADQIERLECDAPADAHPTVH